MNTEKRENQELAPHGQTNDPIMGIPRRVRVTGRQGVDATVVVTAVRDRVWLSISPPLTWETIMEPRKVDEVISVLRLARDEATKAVTACTRRALPGGTAVIPAITRNGSITQRQMHKA